MESGSVYRLCLVQDRNRDSSGCFRGGVVFLRAYEYDCVARDELLDC